MTSNRQVFDPTDLVLVVWPRQSELLAKVGHPIDRQRAASGDWAMDADKADRVRVLISVHEGVIIGAWAVREGGIINVLNAPDGKTRRVNRATFETYAESRLNFLVGQRSPLSARRNPQATMELRDLQGAHLLLESVQDDPAHGVVRLGRFLLDVKEDGSAELTYPSTARISLNPVS